MLFPYAKLSLIARDAIESIHTPYVFWVFFDKFLAYHIAYTSLLAGSADLLHAGFPPPQQTLLLLNRRFGVVSLVQCRADANSPDPPTLAQRLANNFLLGHA